MVNANVIDRAAWVERSRAYAPVIEKHRDEGESQRRLSDGVIEAFRAAGLLRLWEPRVFGGFEVDPQTAVDVIEEVARYDAAAAWTLMNVYVGSAFTAFIPESAAREIYDTGPDTLILGSLQGTAEATRVEGGYEITGEWRFASGCMHAQWLYGSTAVVENGTKLTGPDGAPIRSVVIVAASDATIRDTWHSSGLRASGSHDFTVSGAFVPEGRLFSLASPAIQPGALYSAGLRLFSVPVAAVALGIARDALDSFVELAVRKTPAGSASSLGNQQIVQQALGRAEARLRAARALLREVNSENWSLLSSAQPVTADQAAFTRMASSHVGEAAAEVVDVVCGLAGSSAALSAGRLNRCFRDIHVVTQHQSTSTRGFETAGQTILRRAAPPAAAVR